MENKRELHMKNKKNKTLILFPLPFQGHISPMIQLAKILYSEGFSVTIIHTNFNSIDSSEYPEFKFHSIPDGLPETTRASTVDVIELLSTLNLKCVEPFRKCLAKLVCESKKDEPIACLITDAIWHFAQSSAQELDLPTIVLKTSNACSFVVFSAFPLLHAKGYLPIQECRLEEPIEELEPLKVKDIPIVSKCNLDILDGLLGKVARQLKASSGVIWNSLEELEHDSLTKLGKDFSIPTFPIGPFHKYFESSSTSLLSQDRTCLSWLDTQAPSSVLYVSFGSIAAINATELVEIAWGLANSNQPFLWVVRAGLVVGSEWLELLPKGLIETIKGRGCIVNWAPQQEVLAHCAVGGFWTHNGWNSTLESICEGVPMLCLPNFGDQMVNARYVSNVWRIGIHLENKLERKSVEIAIKRLMVEEEGQELRTNALRLKGKLDLCLSREGSSQRSLEKLVNFILSF